MFVDLFISNAGATENNSLSYKRQLFTQRRKVRKEKQRVGTPKIIHLFGRSVYNRNFSFFLCNLCVLCDEMLFFRFMLQRSGRIIPLIVAKRVSIPQNERRKNCNGNLTLL
jgi:hypothetical protein